VSPQYGSKYELWQWVHHRTTELNAALIAESVTLDGFVNEIVWLGPAQAGSELRDAAWDLVGLPRPSPQTVGWWPPGGPTWDGVARVIGPDGHVGALFVEAKGHDREIRSSGTRATEPSRTTIVSALHDVQNALDVPPGTDWLSSLYQPANRVAWIWFAREHETHRQQPVDAWLASVYFCGGVYPWGARPGGVAGPASAEEWRPFIDDLHREMKLPPRPHLLSDRLIEVFLPVTRPPAPPAPPPTWQR
jgi:hypothetical protein